MMTKNNVSKDRKLEDYCPCVFFLYNFVRNVRVLAFNATVNIISVISCCSVLLVAEMAGENLWSADNHSLIYKLYHAKLYRVQLTCMEIKLTNCSGDALQR